jgi:hypothetical protein
MMTKTNKPYLHDLIRIDIHRLVNEVGYWDGQIGPYLVSLQPERFGKVQFLALHLNNIRQPKEFQLSSQPHRGWLQRNGYIPYYHSEIWYVISNGKRYRYLYINPETTEIGTRADHFPGVHRQYLRKDRGEMTFQDECEEMKRTLFAEKDEFAALHEKTLKRYRLRGF